MLTRRIIRMTPILLALFTELNELLRNFITGSPQEESGVTWRFITANARAKRFSIEAAEVIAGQWRDRASSPNRRRDKAY